MAKVAIKNMNITSFGGIYHIIDVFSKLGFEKLTESVLGKRGSSGKAFCYGSIFCGFSYFPIGLGGGFYAQKRAKKHRSTSYQHIEPQKDVSTYKFSHKKKYCGIKDIRVLFYSSIFQMIIVFPFIVLKYFSFYCHFSHSVLCCNRLVYSCFILIIKSDSKLNQNSSCQLSILFNLFVTHLCLQPVFHFYNLTFLISDCIFFMYSVFPVTLSFLSLCLSSFSFFYYFVFMSFCLFSFCLFSSFCRTSFSLFSFSFWLLFYPFTCLFFDIFA